MATSSLRTEFYDVIIEHTACQSPTDHAVAYNYTYHTKHHPQSQESILEARMCFQQVPALVRRGKTKTDRRGEMAQSVGHLLEGVGL